jgi:hypothetical protein
MLVLSYSFETFIETKAVYTIMLIIFGIYFFLSTQDIAVDGWSATMLSEKNAAHGSTC